MLAKKINTCVIVNKEEILAVFEREEKRKYAKLVPPSLGGTNVKPTIQEWTQATQICYQAANREMINQVFKFIKKDRGVMLVAKNTKHVDILKNILVDSKRERYIYYRIWR